MTEYLFLGHVVEQLGDGGDEGRWSWRLLLLANERDDPTVHELLCGDWRKLVLDFLPVGAGELSFLDVALASCLGVDDIDGALAHLFEGVASQTLLAQVAAVQLPIDDTLHQHVGLALIHSRNEVELGVGRQLDRIPMLVFLGIGVIPVDDLPGKGPLLPHQGSNLRERVHHVVLHLPCTTPGFQLLGLRMPPRLGTLAPLLDHRVKAHPSLVHLLDLVREVQFQLELPLLVVDVAQQDKHLDVLLVARADHHLHTLGDNLVLLAVGVRRGQPLDRFAGVVTGRNTKLTGEEAFHELRVRNKKFLPLLFGGDTPRAPELLVEGNADAPAVHAVLLLEGLDELQDVVLVVFANGVDWKGGFQKSGREVGNDAQRMLLPPSFDQAAFDSVLAQ